MKTKFLTVFCGLLIAWTGTSSCRADDTKAVASIADVVVVRPGCFIATVVGSAFFVLALPFAAASRSVNETAHTLVVKPAQATFTRPVGDFTDLD